ncbi:unnamed protein product, partial [Owenia fusiformis]
ETSHKMAGSRVEKFSSIFSRLRGLLQSGALSESEKPIWHDIYQAFPPKVEPRMDRKVPQIGVPSILYREDTVRAKFYNEFGNPDVIDMTNHNEKSASQRFIDHYYILQKNGIPEEDLFERARLEVNNEGFVLKTMEQKIQEKEASLQAESEKKQHEVNLSTLASDLLNRTEETTDGGDYIIENDSNDRTT